LAEEKIINTANASEQKIAAPKSCWNIALALATGSECKRLLATVSDIMHSQYVHPQHPPDNEYRDDGPRDVNDPVASCSRFSEIEHAAMVAGPASGSGSSSLSLLAFPAGQPSYPTSVIVCSQQLCGARIFR
jgi:hypothetical protein